jgi:pimeloyl-ACP methyl ester carboxylesterase
MRYLIMSALTAVLFQTGAVAAESWTGLYRKHDRTFVGIGEFHEFGHAEILVNYTAGETGQLFPLPDGRIGISGAIGNSSPPSAHVLKRKAGEIFLDGELLRPMSVKRRSFEVRNGSVILAGELVRRDEKPTGVLMFIHGSGDGPRHAYDLWTNFFLSRGWAVVVYDKRGSGQSTGDWHEANFVALADDARGVLRWARAQDELRSLKFGLWGASQAGWIIPQLAAEGLVDFAIVQAGAITPVDDFIRGTLESELRAYSFSPEEIAKAEDYYALDVAVSRGTQPFSAVEAAYRKASAEGTEWLLKPPDPRARAIENSWRRSPDSMLLITGERSAFHCSRYSVVRITSFQPK